MSQRWWCLGALTLARDATGVQFQAIAAVTVTNQSANLAFAVVNWQSDSIPYCIEKLQSSHTTSD